MTTDNGITPKVTGAPWTSQRQMNGQYVGHNVRGPDGKVARVYRMDDADFMVLARNAHDVMTRRGWGVERVGSKWFLAEHAHPKGMAHWGDGFDCPYQCLVAAEAWYRDNVEPTLPVPKTEVPGR